MLSPLSKNTPETLDNLRGTTMRASRLFHSCLGRDVASPSPRAAGRRSRPISGHLLLPREQSDISACSPHKETTSRGARLSPRGWCVRNAPTIKIIKECLHKTSSFTHSSARQWNLMIFFQRDKWKTGMQKCFLDFLKYNWIWASADKDEKLSTIGWVGSFD